MKTSILMLAGLLSAGSAAAQTVDPVARDTNTKPLEAKADSDADQTTQPAIVPPRRVLDPRRRGSMVGYIEDATIASHFRVRFDTASEGQRPDRAEFFYAKCGCYQGLAQAVPPAFDAEAPGPGAAVLTGYDFRQLYFEGQVAIRDRVALFAELPVRWLEPTAFVPGTGSFASTSGLSDIRAGAKLALSAAPDRFVTVLLRGEFPSGDAAKGLGTHHGSLMSALLYFQRVDRFGIEGQIGDWHPFGGSAGVPTAVDDKFAGDVFFYGIGPSYEVYSSDRVRFAPVVELVGWRVLGGFQTQIPGSASGVAEPADGINIVNLKIGARTTIDNATSFYIGYGKALTTNTWYDDIVRFELRYTF